MAAETGRLHGTVEDLLALAWGVEQWQAEVVELDLALLLQDVSGDGLSAAIGQDCDPCLQPPPLRARE